MPKLKIKRSIDENVGVSSTTLLDGELFWDKKIKTLYVGDGDNNPQKIQKQITISTSPPTALTPGVEGDIYIQYLS